VNTGENGWFTHGEFEAITALSQMEMVTPEEIALDAVQELVGRSTGRDVLAALDASILGPTYKGGLLRQVALDRIAQLEGEDHGGVPSVALGDLGPPQLSKEIDAWAKKGWVDLRPASLQQWADRLDRVIQSRRGGSAGGSDAMSPATYGRDDFRPGEIVAWVFANDPDFHGFRIK